MNKNDNLIINWPKPIFTIDKIQEQYNNVPNITLRYRINKALKNGEIICIGKVKKHIGRPKLVFAKSTISNRDLFLCKDSIILNDEMTQILATVKNF